MRSTGMLFAIVLGGAALGACTSTTTVSGSPGDGNGGSPDGSSGSPDGASSSSGGPSSSSSSGSSGASSSSGSSGASSGASGYAIPLTAPDGADFEYTADVTVGGEKFAMQIDTGSATTAVAGSSCSSCTKVSPLYSASSTGAATGKNGQEQFADGSGWSGPIYSDSVDLGTGSPSVSLDLVDISKASGGFFSGENDYQGILGLGPSENLIANTTAYLPAVMGSGVSDVFAFELCDTAGTMWLGGDGSPASAAVYTPLVAISDNNPFYAIDVDGVSLGGTSIATNASNTFAEPVLDTGTSLFYVPTSVFNAFQSALEASSGFKSLFGTKTFSGNNGCVTGSGVTASQVASTLPSLTLSLPSMSGGSDVTIQASALDTYLYDGGGGQFCLALQDGGNQDASTFGDAFLQAFHTVIDVQGGRVGFAASSCPAAMIHHVRHTTETAPHRPPRPLRH